MAKAAYWTVTDVEARKRGEQTGLDTLVVHYDSSEVGSCATGNYGWSGQCGGSFSE